MGLYHTSRVPWGQGNQEDLFRWAQSHEQRIIVAEGQAEPWEPTLVPPSPLRRALYSCTPEDLIKNYNSWMSVAHHDSLYSYLFWGAEYWVLRWNQGDQQYLQALARVLERA